MQVTENSHWVQQQFGSCQLGDKRRTKRVCKMAMTMLDSPHDSLPTQSET
ncbi:MAG: hypothetical protein JKY95_03825 [Planctomycetaceae bacterium]|nr:hypothetical protein [Planctomycetaceae bacterium]